VAYLKTLAKKYLVKLRAITKSLKQGGQFPDRDSNLGPFEHETGIPTTTPLYYLEKNPRYPLDRRRLGGSQGRSGHSGGEKKKIPIIAPAENRTPVVQSVA
jgi:hypothetical protein